jgi:hypothetical protein
MREISRVVIHHSAISVKTQPSSKKMITSMNRTHKDRIWQFVDDNGSTCAYHIFIGKDWDINHVRDIKSIGYANSNRDVNNTAINICVHGTFDKETPTKEQYSAVIAEIKALQKDYKFTIHAHNEFAPKTCPGKNFDMSLVKSQCAENKPLTWPRYIALKTMNSKLYKKIKDPRIREQLRITNQIIRGEI